MSLEQAINDNTAAVLKLAALLAGATIATTAATPAASAASGEATPATKPANTRASTKKTDPANSSRTAEAATGAAAQGVSPASDTKPAEDVSRFFYSAKQDAVWCRKPGDPEVSIPGAVEITAEQFEQHQLRLATKYGNDQTKGVTTTTAADTKPVVEEDPFAEPAAVTPPKEYTYADVVAKLQAVSKHPADQGGGNGKVKEVIATFGADKVPELQTKAAGKFAEVVAACDKVLGLVKA